MITAETVRADGEDMTAEVAARIAARLRIRVGGVYEVVAAQIELDHPIDPIGGA